MTMEIKVFRFLIDSETWENQVCAGDDDRTLRFVLRALKWAPRGDNYMSEPVANITQLAYDIETTLHSYRVKFEKMDEEGLTLYMTNAPQDYDYTGFGTVHLATLDGKMRLVAIPVERASHYQVPRYRSGLHQAWKVL